MLENAAIQPQATPTQVSTLRRVYRRTRRALKNQIPWLRQPTPPGYAGLRRWRATAPIRRNFGWDTGGLCIDRYYIEDFLERNQDLIRGRVLEIADDGYTCRFGGPKVTQSDVLHVVDGQPKTTIVSDLTSGAGIPDNAFDCIILTQTLFCIYDLPPAVRTLYRILAPGGTVLNTEPGISQIARYDMEHWGDCWRFTSCSARKLFGQAFPPESVQVETRGNVLSAIGFLHGMLASELRTHELQHNDPDYQLCVFVKARKPTAR